VRYLKETCPNLLAARQDIESFIHFYNNERLRHIGFVIPYERHTGRNKALKRVIKDKLQMACEHRKELNRQRYQKNVLPFDGLVKGIFPRAAPSALNEIPYAGWMSRPPLLRETGRSLPAWFGVLLW